MGIRGGFRVQLGKESKARKQFTAKYGRETLRLNVFGQNRRVTEGEINAMIIQSLALQGPAWPYQIQNRIRTINTHQHLPNDRTFRRHIIELHEQGYITVRVEEPHHAGRKRTFALTERGRTVSLFLPNVRPRLMEFMDLNSTDFPVIPGSGFFRLMTQYNIQTLAEYLIKAMNLALLTWNFEEIEEQDELWELRCNCLGSVVAELVRRARKGRPIPKQISQDDVRRFNEALEHDIEFRNHVREIIQHWMKAFEIGQALGNETLGALDELDRLDHSSSRLSSSHDLGKDTRSG
jgi:hypothetical protein